MRTYINSAGVQVLVDGDENEFLQDSGQTVAHINPHLEQSNEDSEYSTLSIDTSQKPLDFNAPFLKAGAPDAMTTEPCEAITWQEVISEVETRENEHWDEYFFMSNKTFNKLGQEDQEALVEYTEEHGGWGNEDPQYIGEEFHGGPRGHGGEWYVRELEDGEQPDGDANRHVSEEQVEVEYLVTYEGDGCSPPIIIFIEPHYDPTGPPLFGAPDGGLMPVAPIPVVDVLI